MGDKEYEKAALKKIKKANTLEELHEVQVELSHHMPDKAMDAIHARRDFLNGKASRLARKSTENNRKGGTRRRRGTRKTRRHR